MMKLNDEIKKSNPFKVPDGYFDTLTDRMMAAVKESGEEKQEVDRRDKSSRRITLRPFLALAAAILGFAILATAMVRLVNSGRLSDLNKEGTGLYADLAAEELDTYLIEYELTRAGADEMVLQEGEDISSETIIDYLLMEDIDINDIYELL